MQNILIIIYLNTSCRIYDNLIVLICQNIQFLHYAYSILMIIFNIIFTHIWTPERLFWDIKTKIYYLFLIVVQFPPQLSNSQTQRE